MDISMNAAAASAERSLGRPIMSTCHGMWSLGAMIGSGLGSFLVGVHLPATYHLTAISFLIITVLLILRKDLFACKEEKKHVERVFALPNLTLLLLAFMGFCIMVSEGGVADWSAVFMKDSLHANAFLTGLAYAGYSLLMVIGRMMGDVIIPRFGRNRVVTFGGLLAVAGLGSALIVPSPIVAIAGFSIAGLGYSCIVPVLFMSAANEPGYSSGAGIASVAIVGYSGFLVGPPFIGFLAEAYGLSIGLGFIVFCSLMVSVLSLVVKFR